MEIGLIKMVLNDWLTNQCMNVTPTHGWRECVEIDDRGSLTPARGPLALLNPFIKSQFAKCETGSGHIFSFWSGMQVILMDLILDPMVQFHKSSHF